jgi:GT2 family glycosyltransferase
LVALDRQSLRSFEVIVVDDSSDDDTVEWVRENRPRDVVIELPRRKGLAVALNRGIESANGPYIALLNNDAVPDVDWLMQFDNAFRTEPEVSFLASRIRLYDDPSRLHAAGDTYSRSGLSGIQMVVSTWIRATFLAHVRLLQLIDVNFLRMWVCLTRIL